MSKIKIPRRLKGKMPPGMKAERAALVLKMIEAGSSISEIANSFDISISAVYKMDCVRSREKGPKSRGGYLKMSGVKVGSLGPEIQTIDRHKFDELIARASKKRVTIAQVLVEEWEALT